MILYNDPEQMMSNKNAKQPQSHISPWDQDAFTVSRWQVSNTMAFKIIRSMGHLSNLQFIIWIEHMEILETYAKFKTVFLTQVLRPHHIFIKGDLMVVIRKLTKFDLVLFNFKIPKITSQWLIEYLK